jgi:hypothetical protein
MMVMAVIRKEAISSNNNIEQLEKSKEHMYWQLSVDDEA